MWKKLSQQTLLTHPRLTVLEDEVQLPNGHKTKYIHFQHDGNAVSILCENEKGEILVQEEYSYPPNKIILQLPGGGVPLTEDPIDGAQRELMEETGLRALDMKLLGSYFINNRRTPARMYAYYATKFSEEKIPHDIEESIHHSWITKEEIENKIRSGEIENLNFLAVWAQYKSSTA